LNITEVRVKLMRNRTDRLRAFCSVTVDDDFVVHDLRVIEGRKGLFVAMPSRKLSDSCPECGSKNELRAKFCNACGTRLSEDRARRADASGDKYHVDVAHPINTPCREHLQATVLAAYQEETRRAREGEEPMLEYSGPDLDVLDTSYYEPDLGDEEQTGGLEEGGRPEPRPSGEEAEGGFEEASAPRPVSAGWPAEEPPAEPVPAPEPRGPEEVEFGEAAEPFEPEEIEPEEAPQPLAGEEPASEESGPEAAPPAGEPEERQPEPDQEADGRAPTPRRAREERRSGPFGEGIL
jgi:stage V sporulation protein G